MKIALYIALLLPTLIFSQEKIEGIVIEITDQKQTLPLPGANVYLSNTLLKPPVNWMKLP